MGTTPYGNKLQLFGALSLSMYEIEKTIVDTKALMENLLYDISIGITCVSPDILRNMKVCVWDMQVTLETMYAVLEEYKDKEA